MANTFTYFVASGTIRELNIYKNEKFYKNANGRFINMYTSATVPSYMVVETNPFFKKEVITQDYDMDDIITYNVYKYNSYGRKLNKKSVFKGTIKEICPNGVRVLRTGTVSSEDFVMYDDIISKSVKYYFISSGGIVHKAYKGIDKNADFFREKAHNMYSSKEDATNALYEILNKE